MGPILRTMTKPCLRAGLILAVLALTCHAAAAADRRPVVVELFTSQGCSSCPPADALLGHLADRKDVIALTLPVTYWDMLGWKDTLASDANTRRQKAYASFMGRGGVYTPQMIVDGATDVVGSREAQVEAAISARTTDLPVVPVALSASQGELHVAVAASDTPAPPTATIWLFSVLGKASVAIRSGENGGHTLTYRNVVRDVKALGIWKGQAVSLDLPRGEVANTASNAVAVVVQQGGYGRILGAAFLTRSDAGTNW